MALCKEAHHFGPPMSYRSAHGFVFSQASNRLQPQHDTPQPRSVIPSAPFARPPSGTALSTTARNRRFRFPASAKWASSTASQKPQSSTRSLPSAKASRQGADASMRRVQRKEKVPKPFLSAMTVAGKRGRMVLRGLYFMCLSI